VGKVLNKLGNRKKIKTRRARGVCGGSLLSLVTGLVRSHKKMEKHSRTEWNSRGMSIPGAKTRYLAGGSCFIKLRGRKRKKKNQTGPQIKSKVSFYK